MDGFFKHPVRFGRIAAFITVGALIFTLAACPNPADNEQHTITFDSQGGSKVASITEDAGKAVPKPVDPTKEGYTFVGWFNAATDGEPYEWPYTLNGDVTMYARWTENEIPALTGTVSIDGTAEARQTLTANTESLGGTGTIKYQWQRGDSAEGSFEDIDKATKKTYVVVAGDQSKYIRVTVSRSGNEGAISSAASGPVGLPALTGTVSIDGTAEARQTLTANIEGLGGNGTVSYQWQRGDSAEGDFENIDKATKKTYVVVVGDQDKFIRVTVRRSGNSEAISSAASGPVGLPALTGTVSIDGTAVAGQTLTANTGSLGGTGTISYQWQRGDSAEGDFVDIAGAIRRTYVVVAGDQGKHVRVRVSRSGNRDGVDSDTKSVPLPSLDINIGFNYGAITITGDDGENIIYKTSSTPISVVLSASGYTDVKWYVDGNDTPARTGNTITLNASTYSAKPHYISFTGKKGDKLYSQVIPFTVKN